MNELESYPGGRLRQQGFFKKDRKCRKQEKRKGIATKNRGLG